MKPQVIEELVKHAENCRVVGRSTESYKAVTEEPYVALVSGGIKEERKPFPVWATSEEEAVAQWKTSFANYAVKVKDGVLYWREKPKIEETLVINIYEPEYPYTLKLYTVYSRLLISSKSVDLMAA